ncbi:MAG TPA: diacylglycerol kinase family lipid kinase [Candidatus Scatomorpha stercorigallinarum]|nr:diacylglycerol kinase family lipid kinase [Candidatus Scatomorpha stercorigallinarum]
METKSLLVIVNPVAGRGMYRQGLGEALHILYSAGYVPTVRFTTRAGEAVDLAAEGGAQYDALCCLGGDGTLSDVVTGLMRVPAGQRPPLGYFPLGTANDVATTLRLPKNDPAAAARRMVESAPRPWDVGYMGSGRYFTYVAAFGAFTDVSYETSQQSKQALGHLAYLLEGVNRLAKLPHYQTRVELDGQALEGNFIFGGVTNSTSVAGLVKLDQNLVSLDDGLFEVSLVRFPENLADMNKLMAEVAARKYDGEMFSIRRSQSVRFIFAESVPFTRDGEPGGSYEDLLIENRRAALTLLC